MPLDRPLETQAGHGTGKTTLLLERFAYLVRDRLAWSYGVLLLTFTRRAAREMRERLQLLLAEDVARRLMACLLGRRLSDNVRERALEVLNIAGASDNGKPERARLAASWSARSGCSCWATCRGPGILREKARIDGLLAQGELVQTPDLDDAVEQLRSDGSWMPEATPGELTQSSQTVLLDVYIKHKKVAAIRPKPIYYNLLCVTCGPDGVGFAGDIRHLGLQESA